MPKRHNAVRGGSGGGGLDREAVGAISIILNQVLGDIDFLVEEVFSIHMKFLFHYLVNCVATHGKTRWKHLITLKKTCFPM